MKQQLQTLEHAALAAIEKLESQTDLAAFHEEYLGRKGKIPGLLRNLGGLSDEEKRTMGKAANDLKVLIEGKFHERQNEIRRQTIEKSLHEEWIDLTAPGQTGLPDLSGGHIHPLAQAQKEVEDIFQQMGFTVVDGPEIESEYYNFEGLNIPAHHPARDMQDTFFIDKPAHTGNNYIANKVSERGRLHSALPMEGATRAPIKEGRLVLRTHTSPNQIRAMHEYGAPLRIIVPGRVFRNEATDASHEHTFDQVEGLLIDRDISIAHLKGVMTEFLSRLFRREMKIRFRPGYFPFVEPGMELDMSCVFCNENGCRVCKHTGWIEFMGCGMVHENVLKAGRVDAKKFQGWAFGFGLTRLVMMKYGIDDIRHLTSGDIRFVEQF